MLGRQVLCLHGVCVGYADSQRVVSKGSDLGGSDQAARGVSRQSSGAQCAVAVAHCAVFGCNEHVSASS